MYKIQEKYVIAKGKNTLTIPNKNTTKANVVVCCIIICLLRIYISVGIGLVFDDSEKSKWRYKSSSKIPSRKKVQLVCHAP